MRPIDADALDIVLRNEAKPFGNGAYDYGISDGLALARECVETAPTIDAVPVVRCRECRHNGQPPDKGFAQCELDALIRDPEFWCRAGTREDGDAHD